MNFGIFAQLIDSVSQLGQVNAYLNNDQYTIVYYHVLKIHIKQHFTPNILLEIFTKQKHTEIYQSIQNQINPDKCNFCSHTSSDVFRKVINSCIFCEPQQQQQQVDKKFPYKKLILTQYKSKQYKYLKTKYSLDIQKILSQYKLCRMKYLNNQRYVSENNVDAHGSGRGIEPSRPAYRESNNSKIGLGKTSTEFTKWITDLQATKSPSTTAAVLP
eukprot:TRINITY_DN7747_c0_g3_i1.p1 TRINITY_DN7747_c0_g3~~TRINITY_DN7747_c0_g3_i1.p1  ORF type:complete len:215 (+),score=-9.23 TRINITY_DN7747_c0_g3_i1:252-896(+)